MFEVNKGYRKYDYIVLHTAAHGSNGKDYDTTANEINNWHIARSWAGIGYNFVIRKDGTIEYGRTLHRTPAHVGPDLNAKCIGICMSGHGDISPFTPCQIKSIMNLTKALCLVYDVDIDNIIGHREINKLGSKTSKTCPGTKVNMDEIRKWVKDGW